MGKIASDDYSPEEAAKRRDEVIRRMANYPISRVFSQGDNSPNTEGDVDEKIAKSIRKLNRMIAKEWRAIEPELKLCRRNGEYERESLLRGRTSERQRELVRRWEEWRLTLPPFVTKENGYYVRHPVTPENHHLLHPR